MGTSSDRMMRKLLTLLLFCPLVIWAQRPFINSISPTHVEVGQAVTISGSNLTNVNRVFFGGVSVSGADISVTSDNLMTATVPAGATNGSVIVQTSGSLVAESSQKFFISFSGSSPSAWKAEFRESLTPQTDAYDICLCDLSDDGLNDVVISHNSTSGIEATIFENQSSFNNESFNEISLGDNPDNNNGFISSTCADLDNDGDKDVIFTTNDGTNQKHIYIYRNNGGSPISLTYLGSLNLKLPDAGSGDNRVPRRIKASDIDGDGLLDLVVGNENDNTFHVYPNSSSGSISFGSPTEITVNNATSTGALNVADLNNDGKPDVVIIPAAKSNEQIYVLKNQSIQGDIAFSTQAGINALDQRRNLVIGDFNNDGLNDFAATADRTIGSTSGNESVTVYQNTTSGSDITFSAASTITIPSNLPWGLDAGDINGDGLLDLAVACVGGNVYTIENTTSGTISFGTPTERTTQSNARNICIGDLDQDARPDLAYTHNVNLSQVGDLGIQLNETCIDPVLSPSTFSYCSGIDFTIEATNTANATYTWTIVSGGGPVSTSENTATFNISTNVDETIQVQIDQGGCSTTAQVVVEFEPGSVSGPPTIQVTDGDTGDICVGDQITLSTTTSFDEYLWTLPDGSTSTSATVDFTSIETTDAGTYSVVVKNNGNCSSTSVTEDIQVKQLPVLEITNQNIDNFCSGTSVTLQVPDFTSDFTYQWQRDGTDITGENGNSISANQSGDYTVEVTDATTCMSETATYTINEVSPPSSVVDGPSETCVNFLATFSAASTGQAGFTLTYSWQVDGNAITQTLTDPAQLDTLFTTAGNHTVTLTTSYISSEVESCSDIEVFNVTVSDPPTIAFSEVDRVEKCQGETITISVTNSNISSYSWSLQNAADNSAITIPSATDSLSSDFTVPVLANVDEVIALVDVVTDINCTVQGTITVVNYESTLDIGSDDFTSILEFDSALLEEATSINLSAENAAGSITWGPDPLQFSDPNGTNTIYFPQNPISTVTLNAIDANGCAVTTEVRIELDNIRPKKTFSPNGDNLNDCWEILNIGDLGNENGCKVFVFDSRGRNIIVKDNFEDGDNCVWDGNSNGSPVPEGIYYFVLKCDASEFTKSGSILLAR